MTPLTPSPQAYAKSPLYRGDDGLSIQDLIAKCKQHKVRFIDTEFLPEESSLYEPNSPYKDPNLPLSWRSAGCVALWRLVFGVLRRHLR